MKAKPKVSDKFAEYQRRGYAFTPWAHHPKEIRDELRRIGIRPMAKACFANCQRFALLTRLVGVEYREGWITSHGIPLEHAWLTHNGELVDLTIFDQAHIIYGASVVYDAKAIRRSIMVTKSWTVVSPHALQLLSPWADHIRAFSESIAQHFGEIP
jgi:hypothetical protein